MYIRFPKAVELALRERQPLSFTAAYVLLALAATGLGGLGPARRLAFLEDGRGMLLGPLAVWACWFAILACGGVGLGLLARDKLRQSGLIRGLGRKRRLRLALRSLPRLDLRGRYCKLTPLGRHEHVLEEALMRSRLPLGKKAARRGGVVPQYELLELGWGSWASGKQGTKNYVADFAYLNRRKNLKIDIEVDEFDKGERGVKRDEVFTKRGWTVVRIPEAELLADPARVAGALIELIRGFEELDAAALARARAGARPATSRA